MESTRFAPHSYRKGLAIRMLVLVTAVLVAGCPQPAPVAPDTDGPVGPTDTPPAIELPAVRIWHSPVVAKSSEEVSFTAQVIDAGSAPATVEILVNTVVEETCTEMDAGETCTYTGGPYSDYEGMTVSYLARVTDSAGNAATAGYYYFAITDDDYAWSKPAIPARYVGDHGTRFDFVFHRANDYTSVADFVDHVEDKMNDIFATKDPISVPANLDLFNLYVYSKEATVKNCGTVHADYSGDVTWSNVDAVLHTTDLGDCTSNRHFTAEGSNTKAFLHESGHAVFTLGDEYDAGPACYTWYSQAPEEPNIFETEEACQTEQNAKGRDPNSCRKFTDCQGDWWGIHTDDANDPTVMQWGMVDDKWGTEARERDDHVFANPTSSGVMEAAEAGTTAVLLVPVRYADGEWTQGEGDAVVLPCEPPTPISVSSERNPSYEAANGEGKVLFSGTFEMDPRIVLWPDPEDYDPEIADVDPESPYLLREVSFVIRVPYIPTTETINLYEAGQQREADAQPDLSIDVADAVQSYEVTKAEAMDFPCQDPEYLPDALAPRQ